MILLIFAIYDSKAKAYLTPFFLPKYEMAVRTFKDCVNSKEHQFGKHPEDYILTHIGHFVIDTGIITKTDQTDESCKTSITGISLVELQPTKENNNVEISDETSIQSSS